MKIGVLSDTHDNIWKLAEALNILSEVEVLVHCGDLCSPFVMKQLGEALEDVPIHVVWGNNDGDKWLLSEVANKMGNIFVHGDFAELEIFGKRIGVTHYPEIGRAVAKGDGYDLVCYGHDHTAYEGRDGNTLLLNPGEVMGLMGKRTVAIVNLDTMNVEWSDIT